MNFKGELSYNELEEFKKQYLGKNVRVSYSFDSQTHQKEGVLEQITQSGFTINITSQKQQVTFCYSPGIKIEKL